MIKNKLPLGTKVEFEYISISGHKGYPKTNEKEVAKIKYPSSGIICGTRQLHEGWIEPGSEDVGPPQFYAVKHVDVYLVAIGYNCLVRVQPEDITEPTP